MPLLGAVPLWGMPPTCAKDVVVDGVDGRLRLKQNFRVELAGFWKHDVVLGSAGWRVRWQSTDFLFSPHVCLILGPCARGCDPPSPHGP